MSGKTAPSLKGRFAAAIALAVGFYLLAIVLAAILIGLPIYVIATGHFNLWLTITGLFLGGSILVAAFPRRLRFEAPGVKVDRASQPRLVELVEEEARSMDEKPPHEVYVTMEVNAAVMEAGRGRRVMIVGLPLLQLLTERGFRGVIAHELGHYAGGDTKLGPWIYRTRETIGRTVTALMDRDGDDTITQTLVRQPFIWYGHAFLRITNAISRRQEFAADAIAAQHAGRDAHVEALRRIHGFAPLFDFYWRDDVAPALQSGLRPPMASGFGLLSREERIVTAAGEYLERELAEGKTNPYDSHPSLAERIAAVEHLPAGEEDTSPPAFELIDDSDTLERELTRFLFGGDATTLEPTDWTDIGERVYVPAYEDLVAKRGWLLEGVTFGTLADAAATTARAPGRIQQQEGDISSEDARGLSAAVFGAAGVLALRDAGWSVSALPGLPVVCSKGEESVAPHQIVDAARADDFDMDRYRADIRAIGIEGVALERPASAGEPGAQPATHAEEVPAGPQPAA